MWVQVTIGGSNYLFDPSYKPHDFFAGINYASSMGFSAGQAQTQANSGMTSGTNSGVGFVRSLNYTALKNTVTTYGANLLTAIAAISPAADVKDIIGGRRIQRFETPVGGLRQASLPYTSAVQRTWTGGIPNQYRTTLRVQLVKRVDPGLQTTETFIDRTLYADEIYGRKLVVEPNYPIANSGFQATFQASLRLTDRTGAGTTLATFSKANDPVGLRSSPLNKVLLTVSTPLAPSSTGSATLTGQYLDQTIEKYARYWVPLTIVHAWGAAGTGLQEAWGTRIDTPAPEIPWQQYSQCETCDSYFRENVGDARREQLAVSWMVQASRAAALHAEIAKAEFTHHYSLGVVNADVNMRGNALPSSNPAYIYYSIADSFDRIDIESMISLTSRTDVATERRGGLFAIAATWSALEGAVSGQSSDLPDISATATRFMWGNAPPSGQDFSGGYGARRFYQFTNSTQSSQASTLSRVEGQAGATNPTYMSGATLADGPLLTDTEVQTRRGKLSTAVSDAVAQGYQVTASEEAFLGPGQRAGSRRKLYDPEVFAYTASEQRGGALVAVKYSGSDPISIAHILTGHEENSKGGGGGEQATQKGDYDPATAADILKSKFVDKSQALGIDLKTGAVTYSAPAAIVSGNGSFPYQLTGSLIWRGGSETSTLYGPEDHTRPQTPWTSNWHNALNLSSSAMEAMGASDARAAAGTIALFKAQQDIYSAAASTQRDVAGALASAIWLEQISGNTVNVTVGADSRQFVRAVSGQWIAPGSSAYAELTQTGSRVAHVKPCNGTITWSPTRGWDDSGLSFAVKNANGDTQSFGYWAKNYQSGASASTCAEAHGFRMSSWTFPKGVNVNLAYTSAHSGDYGQMDYLTEVSNTLGWKVKFTYTDGKLTGINNGLAGGDARNVVIGRETLAGNKVISVTDPAGAQTRFTTSIVGGTHRLEKVFDADDGAVASLEYTYDTLDRVKEARDAVALQEGGRNPHAIYLGAGYRSQRTDPLGGTFTVLFDENGRPSRYTDEISRATNVKYDGRGRPVEYQYPELDKEKLEYDARGNITRMTKVAKPSLPEADIVVQAQWDATWNKPSAIIDAMGRQSEFTYKASGLGAGEMLTAMRPAPAAGQSRPTYTFTYGSFGKVATATDPKGVVTSNVYNATNGNLNSTMLDPTGLNLTTSFGYDALGDVTSAADPRGNAISTTYDALRRPTVIKNHSGGTGSTLLAAQRTTYNLVGLETLQEAGVVFSGTNVSSWTTLATNTYSPTGLVRTQTDASGDVVITTYDGMDRVKSVADGESRVMDNVYDFAGQVLKVRRAVGTALQQDYQTNTWTGNGQLASVANAKGLTTTYTYDGFDRPKRVTFPDASYTEALTYNANGSVLTSRTRGAQTLTFSYDFLNRLTRKSTPDRVETFAYDALDLQTCSEVWTAGSATTTCGTGAPTIRVQNAYDNAKRLTSEAQLVAGTMRTVGYGYDASSNRIRIIWPDNWRAVYAFDPMNRMASVGYDADGNGTTDGTLALYQYTPKSQVSGVRRGVAAWGSGNTATDVVWEPDGDLDTLVHTLNGETAAWDYGYDRSAKITSEMRSTLYSHAPASAQSITYNVGAVGSTTQKLDQYATAAGQAATYDANGNRATLAGLTTTHDSENRLVSASTTGMSVTYLYDANGRRLMKDFSSGGTDTVFLSAGDMEIAEYNDAMLLRRYVPSAKVDDRVAMIEATGAISYYHADRIGNVVAVTNSSGAATDRYKYTPFGIEEPLATSGNPYRYTGQRYDPETGLHHYRARYYDPSETGGGRFLEVDPIGYKDQVNLYAYVGNDPMNMRDPSGTKIVVSGSSDDIRKFTRLVYMSTGIRVAVSRDGTLTRSAGRDRSVGNPDTAKALNDAIKETGNIRIELVNNDPAVMGDKFSSGEFDVADFSKFSSRSQKLGSALMSHVLAERREALYNAGDFDQSHKRGVEAESRVMGAYNRTQQGLSLAPDLRNGTLTFTYMRDAQNVSEVYSFRVVDGVIQ